MKEVKAGRGSWAHQLGLGFYVMCVLSSEEGRGILEKRAY